MDYRLCNTIAEMERSNENRKIMNIRRPSIKFSRLRHGSRISVQDDEIREISFYPTTPRTLFSINALCIFWRRRGGTFLRASHPPFEVFEMH